MYFTVYCVGFLTSKYCGVDEYYRLYMKPSVHNKVEQIQNQDMWLILCGSNDGEVNNLTMKIKSTLLRAQRLAQYYETCLICFLNLLNSCACSQC